MAVTYPLDVPLARDPAIAVTVLGFVATLTTGLRCYGRYLRNTRLGLSEYLIFGALLIVYVDISIEYILTILGGSGRDIADVEPESVVVTLKTILPLEALYGIGMSLVKSSIMVFFYQIFGANKSFKTSMAVVMTIVWIWATSIVLETFLLCRPLAFNWDQTIPGGVCGQRDATFVAAGTINLITDLMVMALPLPHIWKLKLDLAKKVALSMIFCLGLLVSVISIVRLTSLMTIDFDNITASVQMGVLWTIIEPELAIICANMSLLAPVVSIALPKLFRTSVGEGYYGSDAPPFEQLDERTAYQLDKLGRDRKTEITSGTSSRRKDPYPLTMSGSNEELVNPANDGINVTQNFNIKYGRK